MVSEITTVTYQALNLGTFHHVCYVLFNISFLHQHHFGCLSHEDGSCTPVPVDFPDDDHYYYFLK